jgi:outer membrane protein TolC
MRLNGDRRSGCTGWRGALAGALALLLGGCAITTPRLDTGERERLAAEARRQLFEGQEPIVRPLTLAEATARAIKYQAEHRQRRMEEAAAEAQLDVAQFDLLPRLALNAGYSTRNNEAFGFGFTPGGTIATTPTASVERTRTTASVGLAWNLLDFGVSYFRARQLSDQKLIAEERRRKAVQTLMHDVRVAWWRAEAAERLLPRADRLLAEIEQAIEKTRLIETRKLLPPVQTATLRRALLDLGQQIAFRRQDLAQAKIELAALVNAPPAAEFHVATLEGEAREVLDLTADVDRLESVALRTRPEMAEEGYRARISADEARKALLGLAPGFALELGRNYDSNRFLLNNTWTSSGLNVVFNLVKVFSLPALRRSEEAQRRADEARRQAMAIAILAQTRLAAVRYTLVADEFLIWDEAARDDDLIVKYLASSEKAGIDNELELIRARARAVASHINRGLAYANVQASVARLYNSVGYDAVPREDEARAVADLSDLIATRLDEIERTSFSPRAAAAKPTISVERIGAADARVAALLREGAERVLSEAGHAPAAGAADVRLELLLELDPVQEGRRAARVRVIARPAPGGATELAREFRTTLSEPVDDEQWRVLGEGAAYRVLGELGGARLTRPALRTERELRGPGAWAPVARAGVDGRPDLDGAPLKLRLEEDFGSASGAADSAGN